MKIVLSIIIIALSGFLYLMQKNGGDKMNYEQSPNFRNGKFQNLEETPVMNADASYLSVMRDFMRKGGNREPESALATLKFSKDQFLMDSNNIKAVWFGHSTVLLNINGLIVITDPIFGKRASPVSFAGTKKFDYTNDYKIEDLPDIDIVLISHDHYDHLDKKSIKKLNEKTACFVVPLGVEKQLIKWEIDEEKIIDLDWWQQFKVNSEVAITMTPARHFSGRGLTRNKTLWCSYVILNNDKKVFFSGDSGYGEHFKDIGEKFESFDLTLMECGQYNENWSLIHMDPSETFQANKDLGGKKMIPLHWGKFNLSLHSWTEPVELLLKSSNGMSAQILTPKIGELAIINESDSFYRWWR